MEVKQEIPYEAAPFVEQFLESAEEKNNNTTSKNSAVRLGK